MLVIRKECIETHVLRFHDIGRIQKKKREDVILDEPSLDMRMIDNDRILAINLISGKIELRFIHKLLKFSEPFRTMHQGPHCDFRFLHGVKNILFAMISKTEKKVLVKDVF